LPDILSVFVVYTSMAWVAASLLVSIFAEWHLLRITALDTGSRAALALIGVLP